MRDRSWRTFLALFVVSAPPIVLTSCLRGPAGDSAAFDADGTAHIARSSPCPSTSALKRKSGWTR